MTEQSTLPVSVVDTVIIGAGTSGLSVAYYLRQRGIHPLILEVREQIATSWKQRHPQLRLNTHRRLSSLPGKLISARSGAFVSRDDYVKYLEDYVQWLSHRWDVRIRFGVLVQGLEREPTCWRLATPQGEIKARHVIVATGPDRQPFVPSWHGLDSFQGEKRHAADFGNIEGYRGKRVLIVGGANSGIDLANHLLRAGHCQSLAISMRQGTHLLPTRLLGIPVQLTAPLLEVLPLKMQDRIANVLSRLTIGNLEPWNTEPLSKAFAPDCRMKVRHPGLMMVLLTV